MIHKFYFIFFFKGKGKKNKENRLTKFFHLFSSKDGREIIKQHFSNGWEKEINERKRKKKVSRELGPADDLLNPAERHIFLVVESAKIKKKRRKEKEVNR